MNVAVDEGGSGVEFYANSRKGGSALKAIGGQGWNGERWAEHVIVFKSAVKEDDSF